LGTITGNKEIIWLRVQLGYNKGWLLKNSYKASSCYLLFSHGIFEEFAILYNQSWKHFHYI